MEKHQFTSGMPKQKFVSATPEKTELEENGQYKLDFSGKENKKPRDFLSDYTSEQRLELTVSVREKQVKNIPLNEEETEFWQWSNPEKNGGMDKKDKKGYWWN